MDVTTPMPEDLETMLEDKALVEDSSSKGERRDAVRAEAVIASKYWGGFQSRIVVTFLVCAAGWTAVLIAGLNGTLPLWVGFIANSILATTFYMPMHEAVHRNIWGKQPRLRAAEDVIGLLCSIPTGINYATHRTGHMRHHAYTNDPERDPDHFTDGRLAELPLKFVGMTVLFLFLPVFALVKPTRRVLPASLQVVLSRQAASREEAKPQIRFWMLTTAVLIASFVLGHGVEAVMLWWLPSRVQLAWLLFIFAWYPHHPASETSRYRHTRVAVFPGSGLLVRGHDHHAIHHLYPRVPHYRLKALWGELSGDLVPRGVRAEGRAVGATGPIVW
jgi:beta-carotene hydroxylase